MNVVPDKNLPSPKDQQQQNEQNTKIKIKKLKDFERFADKLEFMTKLHLIYEQTGVKKDFLKEVDDAKCSR